MDTDAQLTKNFRLSEAPCWQKATELDAQKLQETAARVLQPIRNRFGRTKITSWKWWRSGCTPRTGSHAGGGTVDFVVANGKTLEAWEWGATNLLPTGYIGRWIYEPQTATQGEHIHVATRPDMVAHNGDATIQALKENPDGSYFLAREMTAGSFVNPYQLAPLVVSAKRAGLPWYVGLPLLFGLFVTDMAGQASGGWQFKRS